MNANNDVEEPSVAQVTLGMVQQLGFENAITKICQEGNLEGLKYLLSDFGGKCVTWRTLIPKLLPKTAECGQGDIIFKLIEWAKANGHALMPYQISAALTTAITNNHKKLAADLFAYSDSIRHSIHPDWLYFTVMTTANRGHRVMFNYILDLIANGDITVIWLKAEHTGDPLEKILEYAEAQGYGITPQLFEEAIWRAPSVKVFQAIVATAKRRCHVFSREAITAATENRNQEIAKSSETSETSELKKALEEYAEEHYG